MRLFPGSPILAALLGLSAVAAGQCEIDRLHPGDPITAIGYTGAFADGIAAISGPPNRVAVFEYTSGGWIEAANFASPGGYVFYEAQFAASRYVVVSGMRETPLSNLSGRAYVFERQDGWTQPYELSASDEQANDAFGAGVATDGDTIVVGAPMDIPFMSFGPGKAYVFERGGSGWVQTARFEPHGYFGVSVSYGTRLDVAGDKLVIGAASDDQLHEAAGAVYVYERGPTGWSETAKLFASDATMGTGLGKSVAVQGTTLLAGAREAVYVFERTGSGWMERQILTSSDPEPVIGFGYSVDLDGDRAVIGAPLADGDHANAGAVYVFDRRPAGPVGTWSERSRIVADAGLDARFGSVVALDFNQLCSLPGPHAGDHARLYSLGLGSHTTFCTATPNSTGTSSRISAEGCDSVLAGELTLHAVSAPPGQPGLFLYAASTRQSPLADSVLCLGAPLHRLPPTVVDAAGHLSTSVDFDASEAQYLTPGTTTYFQAYFRDDPSLGTGANLSDALALQLTP